MQVQELKNEGLTREFSVTIPNENLESALVKKLEEIGKTVKVQGFRPGKVPMSILRKRFGGECRAEILDQAVNDSIQKTLSERKLRPAVNPKIELINFAENENLQFKMDVEVLPEVEPMDFSQLTLDKPVVPVTEQQIEEVLERAVKNSLKAVKLEEQRAAQMGDHVVFDFDGAVDGERKPGMKAEGHVLELGSKQFIDTFEEQLVGLIPGDSKTVKVTFPADYHATELASKAAEFEVKLHEIRTLPAVEINDAVAKERGFVDLKDFRNYISKNLESQKNNVVRDYLKRKLFDLLAEKHNFALPASLVEREFENIWKEVAEERTRGALPEKDMAKSEDDLKKEYRNIAERRVRVGLLLSEVDRRNKIDVTPVEMREMMTGVLRNFPGREKEMLDRLKTNEAFIENMRAQKLEEKAVDFVLGKVSMTDKIVTDDELKALMEQED